jgi:hypothetical protein
MRLCCESIIILIEAVNNYFTDSMFQQFGKKYILKSKVYYGIDKQNLNKSNASSILCLK